MLTAVEEADAARKAKLTKNLINLDHQITNARKIIQQMDEQCDALRKQRHALADEINNIQ